jgi:hypothetical protein
MKEKYFMPGFVTGGIVIGFIFLIMMALILDGARYFNKLEKVCIWHNGIPYYLESEKKRVCIDRDTRQPIDETKLTVPIELDK